MDTTVRNLDEQTYRAFRARAVKAGRTVGDLLSEAMREYLVRDTMTPKRSTLRSFRPEDYGPGTENLGREIDELIYGAVRR